MWRCMNFESVLRPHPNPWWTVTLNGERTINGPKVHLVWPDPWGHWDYNLSPPQLFLEGRLYPDPELGRRQRNEKGNPDRKVERFGVHTYKRTVILPLHSGRRVSTLFTINFNTSIPRPGSWTEFFTKDQILVYFLSNRDNRSVTKSMLPPFVETFWWL